MTKLHYDYTVLDINKAGIAVVEYRNERLGAITRTFFIPYHLSNPAIHNTIVMNLPIDLFYSRHLALALKGEPTRALVNGSVDISFDDHFYDIQVTTADTLVVDDEEKNN